MPQDPIVPNAPQGETSSTPPTPPPPGGALDLSKILLPKKPAPGASLDSASRINAGALLDAEQSATLPTPPKPAPPPPEPKKDPSVVKAVQTFQTDIQDMVGKQNASVVSIAAAEAERRAKQASVQVPVSEPREWISTLIKTLAILGGVLLLLGAGAAVYLVTRPAPSVTIAPEAQAPFITVDQTLGFSVPLDSFKRTTGMAALEAQRQKINLSLGLMARIYLTIAPSTEGGINAPLPVSQLFPVLAPNAPDSLVRALDPYEYLLGIHSYDENQAFLILKATSYEQAFSGILEWEPLMRQDLLPLFKRTPPVHAVSSTATTTATSSVSVALKFVDRIIENHDTRTLETNSGDILLLWAFIDRTTLVIATNEATFREILSRHKNFPVLPLP